jgi:hypothetical protein
MIDFCVGIGSSIVPAALLSDLQITIGHYFVNDMQNNFAFLVEMNFKIDTISEDRLHMISKLVVRKLIQ